MCVAADPFAVRPERTGQLCESSGILCQHDSVLDMGKCVYGEPADFSHQLFCPVFVLLTFVVAGYGQREVTKFLGIPVDGYKQDMINQPNH